MLSDGCGIWIRDGSGEIRPFIDDPPECGTGIERDGNPIDGDLGLLRFICVGLIKDGELTTTSESVVVVVVSSIFLTFSFDFLGFVLVISLS